MPMIERLLANPGLLAAVAEGGFVWQEHTRQIVTAALLSMVPTFEGRYAVTVALGMGMPPVFSYLLALICSSLPVPIILLLLRPVLEVGRGEHLLHSVDLDDIAGNLLVAYLSPVEARGGGFDVAEVDDVGDVVGEIELEALSVHVQGCPQEE